MSNEAHNPSSLEQPGTPMSTSPDSAQIVHIVDDETSVRDSLQFMFSVHGYVTRSHVSGEAFLLHQAEHALRGCVLLDVRMEPLSGLRVHEELLTRQCRMPVIFLTGHGDIPMAIKAVKRGAFDFIEKPFNDAYLLSRVKDALALEVTLFDAAHHQQSAQALWASLSKREVDVITRVAMGKLNKIIADELSIALRTVEVHRASALAKLGIKSSAEAATLIAQLQLKQ